METNRLNPSPEIAIMKLNFWQWLGLLILIVGGAYWVYSRVLNKPAANAVPSTPTASFYPG
jgi:hypothetical protein